MLSPKDKFKRSSRCCSVCFLFILGIQIALGIAAAASSYHGFCYGFTDGSWPCTFGEKVVLNISYLSILFCLIIPIPFLFWGIAVGRVLSSFMKLRPAISVVLTFPLAIAGAVLGVVVGINIHYFLYAVVEVIGI
jgi:hypothetical protein